jgi:chemotaxis protein MotB
VARSSSEQAARSKTELESLWLVTFADLMVQLMAYFALLYSFSVSDQTKLQTAVVSIQKALGVKPEDGVKIIGDGILPGSTALDPAKATDLEKLLSAAQVQEGKDLGTKLQFVSFRGALGFEEGSPALTLGSDVLLVRLSSLMTQYAGFTLVCEGHAAQGERGRNGVDALELSAQRAMAAQRYLAALGVPPQRLASEAHGDTRIEDSGDTPEGRGLQRRVTFRFQRVAER